jgi:hypothetical protein
LVSGATEFKSHQMAPCDRRGAYARAAVKACSAVTIESTRVAPVSASAADAAGKTLHCLIAAVRAGAMS